MSRAAGGIRNGVVIASKTGEEELYLVFGEAYEDGDIIRFSFKSKYRNI